MAAFGATSRSITSFDARLLFTTAHVAPWSVDRRNPTPFCPSDPTKMAPAVSVATQRGSKARSPV